MKIGRFRALSEIHGSDLQRWPEAEREPARVRVNTDAAFAEILEDAAGLDEWLDHWTTPRPTAVLRDRVLASAPNPRTIRRARLGFWLSGAGFAAAGLVGMICGMTASSAVMADARDEALVASATSDGLGSFRAALGEGRRARVRTVEQTPTL
jgi:hypothetical protein